MTGKIGKILRTMRRIKNLKQTDISKVTSIPQNTLSQYETGVIVPKYDDVERIANACGFKIYFKSNDNNTIYTSDNIDREEI